VKIRDLCLAEGLDFWMVGGNRYDLRHKNDRMDSGIQTVQAERLAGFVPGQREAGH
jgi:hypothetical protein